MPHLDDRRLNDKDDDAEDDAEDDDAEDDDAEDDDAKFTDLRGSDDDDASVSPLPPPLTPPPPPTWRLESSDEIYWNVADVATFKNGVRNNLNAKCTASSQYATKTCPNAFNGIMTSGDYWSCDWNVEQPTYWLSWEGPAADTLKIYQAAHEHTSAKIHFGGKVCNLPLNRVRGQYVEFDLETHCGW